MDLITWFQEEINLEAITTEKMLTRVPMDRLDWQPHPKSMTLRQLTIHLAELTGWIETVVTSEGIDFESAPYAPPVINNQEELLAFFHKSQAQGLKALGSRTEDDLEPVWTMRSGDIIMSKMPKKAVIRMVLSQTIHHRAQLGVYLRLLKIPIPGSYGPSADEA